jgi:hypothetical protein
VSERAGHRGDPTWYRIVYALAVQQLHASEPAGAAEPDAEDLRARVARLLTSSESQPERPSLSDAEDTARRLLDASSSELARAGWRWASQRPAWHVRRYRRLRSWRQGVVRGELADFLDRTLEPATVALLWSIAVARGQALPPDRLSARAEDKRPEVDRRAAIDEGWLTAYLELLLAPPPRIRGVARRVLGVIGFGRHRPRRAPSDRVLYNLACTYSRAAVATGRAQSAYLHTAVALLTRCFAGAAGRRAARLAQWARRDPGLAGLRELAPAKFEAIVERVDPG